MKRVGGILVFALLLTACEQQVDKPMPAKPGMAPASTRSVSDPPPSRRTADMAQIVRGGRVFQENCAACHGARAQGAQNWQRAGPDGKYPAPPLNGTGHAWHHPSKVLRHVIRNGTAAQGGSMPGWKDALTDHEIDDVIAWFQSKWPSDVYAAWHRRERESQRQ